MKVYKPNDVLRTFTKDNGETYRIRIAQEEQDFEDLNEVAKNSLQPVRSFPYIWRSWGNWESNPPIVIESMDTGEIAGFHAAAFLKMGYVNGYYIVVDSTYKRRGLGADLLDVTLEIAPSQECTRFTCRTSTEAEGWAFYSSFGLEPSGKMGKEYVFDFDIEGIHSVAELREALKTRDLRTDKPPILRKLKQYHNKLDECYLPGELFEAFEKPVSLLEQFGSSTEGAQ